MDVWFIIEAKTRKPIRLSVAGHEILSVFYSKHTALQTIAKEEWDFEVDIVQGRIEWEK